jgi:small-conductance mechanosensitive channel
MRRTVFVIWVVMLFFAAVARGQQAPAEGTVQVQGRKIFVLKSGIEKLTPAERAQAINNRLQVIASSPPGRLETHVENTEAGLQVLIGSQVVVTVTDDDAKALGTTDQELAQKWAEAIQQTLSQSSEEEAWRATARRVLIAVLILGVAFALVVFIRKARRHLAERLDAHRERIPAVRLRGLQLISPVSIARSLARLLWLVAVGVSILVCVTALLLVFAQIPETRGYAYQIFLWMWDPFVAIVKGALGYLPNLFYILVISVVARMVTRAIGFVFEQAHRGVISLEPWVHADVARPTAQIIKTVVIILALFFIAPLIPGTGSTAARGISVILGLMVSFGSTSTIGNLIAGVVLTYMRPFQIGERVKVGDTVGDVIERTFLYIKIRTIKNEQVIVPSLLALNTSMVNYSSETRMRGLILHTSVTIGYDAPWRKVHELLQSAADRTENVLKSPKPFVLQTSLSDFFVNYQLNAYTDQPTSMAQIYSDLHQNIQDSFNEGGVEIMSPHYMQLRDGNSSTIPGEAEKKPPRRFRFEAVGAGS